MGNKCQLGSIIFHCRRQYISIIFLLISISTCLYGASETSNWVNYPKWLTGSGVLGNWSVKANTGTWDGSNWVILVSTEDPTHAIYPGYNYNYLYITTTPAVVWDQRTNNRTLNLPILGFDAALAAGTTYYKYNDYIIWYGSWPADTGFWEVYDNWGGGDTTDSRNGSPLPPTGITGELVLAAADINAELQWTAPTWGGVSIQDLITGGGYEVWRSSYSSSFSADAYTLAATILGPAPVLTCTDTGLSIDTTYYYSLRSYDAYLPPDYSDFSTPAGFYGVSVPVDVTFKIDISGYTPKKVYVAGDFTDSLWTNGKIIMNDNKDGTWQANVPYSSAAPLKFIVGKTIQYKYILDDSLEPDFITTSKNREVVLVSSDTVLSDMWGIFTITSTPKNLPEEIVSFRTEPGDSYCNVIWETDPKGLPNILGYQIDGSTDNSNFSTIASSDTLTVNMSSYTHSGLTNGSDYYYKISLVYSDGSTSTLSDSISVNPPATGEETPALIECTDAPAIVDLTAMTGYNTGEVILMWTAPDRSATLGAANSYIIRRSTYPMTTVSSFKRGTITGREKAHYTGTGESYFTVNLGTYCPGYYFGIEPVYGNWYAATVSNNIIGVAGNFLLTKSGGTTEKAVKYLGDENITGVELYANKPSIEFKKHAVDIPNAVFVVKNSVEIDGSAGQELKNNITAAANPAQPSQKRLKILAENTDLQNKNNTIFEFTALDRSMTPLFTDTDGENVKLPFIVSIPYDMLDANNNDIVDSTEGTPEEVRVTDLRVYHLNEQWNFWQRLKTGRNSVDTKNKLVKAETKHLSVFCLAAPGNAASDLSNVVVFPNPFKPYDGMEITGTYDTGIIFTNLTPTADITIYTIAAEVVKKHEMDGFSDDEREGKWKWDARNSDGDRVASGVYIFLVRDGNVQAGDDKFVGKLCIIR